MAPRILPATIVKRGVAMAVIAFAVVALAGCSAGSGASGSSTTHVAAPVPSSVSGTLPGLQVIAGSSLSATDKQAVGTCVAAQAPADSAPTLATGTYKPLVDGHVQVASVEATSDNGIMAQVATVQLDPVGTKALDAYTSQHPNETIVVALNGRVLMAGTLDQPITDGQIELPRQQAIIEQMRKAVVPALP